MRHAESARAFVWSRMIGAPVQCVAELRACKSGTCNARGAAHCLLPHDPMAKYLRRLSTISFALLSGCTSDDPDLLVTAAATGQLPDVVITMDAAGNFSPQHVFVADGQAVKWVLYDRKTDAVARALNVTWPAVCASPATYTTGPNELTGPMRRAQSGVFTLNPNKYGYAVKQAAEMTFVAPNYLCPVTGQIQNIGIPLDPTNPSVGPFLCEQSGDPAYYQKTLDTETWGSSAITGVFIRLHWKDVHTARGVFDWSTLDREILQAVAKNKLYSIAVQAGENGTPDWMYTDATEPVNRLVLDANEDTDQCRYQDFGDITDPDYATHYKAMLTSLAAHLKSNTDWYRRLAYIKPSGANLSTAENRLPNGCKAVAGNFCGGVPSCNAQTWAAAGYTKQKLYAYYTDITNHIATTFPNKSMSYALIQAGFPKVNAAGGPGCYENAAGTSTCNAGFSVPNGTAQTEAIIQNLRAAYNAEAVVSHNGLGTGLDPNGVSTCTVPGTNGGGCPNWWAYNAGATWFPGTTYGQAIGYQTMNAERVRTPLDLHNALENMWNNSSGMYLEIYEAVHWQARYLHAGILNLGQGEPLKSLGDWRNDLTARRDTQFPSTVLPENSPVSHRVVFTRTLAPGFVQKHTFINPSGTKCAASATAWGTVTVGAN